MERVGLQEESPGSEPVWWSEYKPWVPATHTGPVGGSQCLATDRDNQWPRDCGRSQSSETSMAWQTWTQPSTVRKLGKRIIFWRGQIDWSRSKLKLKANHGDNSLEPDVQYVIYVWYCSLLKVILLREIPCGLQPKINNWTWTYCILFLGRPC